MGELSRHTAACPYLVYKSGEGRRRVSRVALFLTEKLHQAVVHTDWGGQQAGVPLEENIVYRGGDAAHLARRII